MGESDFARFQDDVWSHYYTYGRHDLPWRVPEAGGSFDPYKILVSEVMLQQTQVVRVIPKYREFLAQFPDTAALAHAPLSQVLAAWSGLGYNRRAKYLWMVSRAIESGGSFPQTEAELRRLPGIGPNTAAAVMVYAFNLPAIFVETNIRTVYIHHFFKDQSAVSDRAILELVQKTLDRDQPRIWYWALMDYGSFLKSTVGNVNHASKSYAKQSGFAGSKRQVRGRVIHGLLEKPMTRRELEAMIADSRLDLVLADLLHEEMIMEYHGSYTISSQS